MARSPTSSPHSSQIEALKSPDMEEKPTSTTAAALMDSCHSDSKPIDLKELGISQKRSAGVAFLNLNVFGFGTTTGYQRTISNYPLVLLSQLGTFLGRSRKSRIDILRDFGGVVSAGEMLLVLGRPGSGCTTFLKTLAGHTNGLHIDQTSQINYQGTQSPGYEH